MTWPTFNSQYFLFSYPIFSFLATLLFASVCIKRKDLIKWLVAYITFTIGLIFNTFKYEIELFDIIGSSLFLLSCVFMFLAVTIEYRQTFNSNQFSIDSKLRSIFTIPIIFLMGIYGIMITISILSILMLIRIYLYKRRPTHAFLCFTWFGAFITIITQILKYLEIEGALEFTTISTIFLIASIIGTTLAVIVEERLMESEEQYRKAFDQSEFYKDLFAHDIGNIFQTIQSSIDLLSYSLTEDIKTTNNTKQVMDIAKGQLQRGIGLGLNVRRLSEITGINIPVYSVNMNKILKTATDEIKKRFPEKNVNFLIESEILDSNIYANEYLLYIFENIFDNAVRFNNNQDIVIKIINSTIEKEKKKYIRIDISDNGLGIPPDLQDTISQQLHSNISDRAVINRRIGLGLILVREIIKIYKGDIWIKKPYKRRL